MPWRETTVLDDRIQFIAMYLTNELSMADLCRAFGISRKTGYKFVQRYELCGPEGLHDLPHAPYSHPNAVPEDIQEQIIALRSLHPTWGPRKLRVVLARDIPQIPWPAASTIGEILKRRGLAIPRRHRSQQAASPSVRLTQPGMPNDVWCADFKGHFGLRNGRRCHPFTITDDYSRALLRCQALHHIDTDAVKPIWVAAFREYGLPRVIRTDNGPPFASTGLGGLSPLAVWWIRLGIRPERIEPGHPEQNGRHERMHRTLKQDAAKPPQADITSQQHVFDRFRHDYNNLRPHEALGQHTPSSVYVASQRSYPLREPQIQYRTDTTLRHVRTTGCIRWQGKMLFVSETLVGHIVGLEQLDDQYWALYFGPIPLAILDNHLGSWAPPKTAFDKLQLLQEEDTTSSTKCNPCARSDV